MKKFLIILCAVVLVQSSALAANQEPTTEQLKYRQELKESKINFKASVFYMLISKGDSENVEKFLKAGMNPNTKYAGEPAIFTAIRFKQDKVFDLLLQYGADVQTKHALTTTLEWALSSKNTYATKQLIAKGVKPTEYAISMGRNSKDLAIRSLFVTEEPSKICTVQPQSKQPTSQATGRVSIEVTRKDPGLIATPTLMPVANDLFNKKMANDNQSYSAIKPQLTEEQYKIYRVVEKILRANNLEYQNWRVGFDLNPEEINASSSTANLILISSALYDSLNQNQDAMALVASHEIAHFLLGHQQKSLENNYKIQQAQASAYNMDDNAAQQRDTANMNTMYGYNQAALANGLASLSYSLGAAMEQNAINNIYKQEREQEYQADAEATELMTRAGYNVQTGLEGFKFLSAIPSYYTARSTHPPMTERIANIHNQFAALDENGLINEGRSNLYNSNVLDCVQSMDKKTIVINKPAKYSKIYYQVDTQEEKYLRKGYVAYTKNNLETAIELFKKAYDINYKGYIAQLYLSYAYEDMYRRTGDKKYLRKALSWANKGNWYGSRNQYVIAQKADVEKQLYGGK